MVPRWIRFSLALITIGLLLRFTAAVDPPEPSESSSAVTVRDYFEFINPKEIERLQPSFPNRQDRLANSKLPFYGDIPLPSIAEKPEVVQQALRDFGEAGIVDKDKGETVLLRWSPEHQVWQDSFKHSDRVINVFNLDPKYHELKSTLRKLPRPFPRMPHVDGEIHVNERPLLTETATLDQMLAASTRDHGSFFVPGADDKVLLIDPHIENMVETYPSLTKFEVARLQEQYRQASKKFGPVLASLKYGRPLARIPEMDFFVRKSRLFPPSKTYITNVNFPRLEAQSATRQQMINALASKQGFDLLDGHRVIEARLNGPPSFEPSQWALSVLEKEKQDVEGLSGVFNRFHL